MSKVILVIEDDPDQRRLVERVLTTSGYRVFLANDGESGLEAARAVRPALIILDIVMPRMNGYQTCRALRQEQATASTPILMLTSKHEPADQMWAGQVGATEFFTKPVTPAELMAVVQRLAGAA